MSKFGLIGKNIDYSFSKAYFTDKFENEGLLHSYQNFDISTIDEFSEVSHHGYDKLNSLAISNRVLLKKIMSEAGFTPYPYEWWHYSYKQVDYNLDDFIWTCN